jgi:hypothetical protein
MKRVLLAAIVAALFGTTARAETIAITDTDTNATFGYLTYARTTYSSAGLDRIVVKLSSFLGDAVGTALSGMEGTWSAAGSGKTLSAPTGTYTYDDIEEAYSYTYWTDYTTNTYSTTNNTNKTSYVNLPSTDAGTLNTTDGLSYDNFGHVLFSREGTWDSATQTWNGTSSDYIQGTWLTTGTHLSGTSTLAVLYVTTGGDVSFTGALSLDYNGGQVPNVTFTTAVPEPGTLAMLAAGLFGLVAYAWRKRK